MEKIEETCFSTAPPVTTSSRAIAAFVRPSAISARTSRSRGVSAASAPSLAVAVAVAEQLGDDLAVERRAAGRDALDRLDERAHVADALLEQVAEARGAGREQLGRVDGLDVLAEDQDAGLRVARAQLDRGAHALVGERRREPHVDDRQVGLVRADDPQQPGAVVGVRDDLDPALAHERDEPLAQQRVVLGDHDPHGSSTRIVVPPPGRADHGQRPVERLGPVAQPGEARAARVRAARPVVGDLHQQPPVALGRASRVADAPGACLATFVSDSATTKYAAVSTTGERALGQVGRHA